MIDKKRFTLILNSHFLPLTIEGAKRSLEYLVSDKGKALDPKTFLLYSFEEWIKTFNFPEPTITMRSEKLWVLIPEIIVLNTTKYKKRYVSSRFSKRKILLRDNFLCGYCGKHLTYADATVDHIIPISKGGNKSDYKNVISSCFDCNSKKADKSVEELGWELKFKPTYPKNKILSHVPKMKWLDSWKPFIVEEN